MSGGHFDYNQFRLDDIVSELEKIIELEESINYYICNVIN